MADAWYYERDGRSAGPVTADQLKQLAASGRLRPADRVWRQGTTDRVPASRVKDLFSASPSLARASEPSSAPITADTVIAPRSRPVRVEEPPPPSRRGLSMALAGALLISLLVILYFEFSSKKPKVVWQAPPPPAALPAVATPVRPPGALAAALRGKWISVDGSRNEIDFSPDRLTYGRAGVAQGEATYSVDDTQGLAAWQDHGVPYSASLGEDGKLQVFVGDGAKTKVGDFAKDTTVAKSRYEVGYDRGRNLAFQRSQLLKSTQQNGSPSPVPADYGDPMQMLHRFEHGAQKLHNDPSATDDSRQFAQGMVNGFRDGLRENGMFVSPSSQPAPASAPASNAMSGPPALAPSAFQHTP